MEKANVNLAPALIDFTQRLIPAAAIDPFVHDVRTVALRQQMVTFTAKRFADMVLVSGHDLSTARSLFRPGPAVVPGNLTTSQRPASLALKLANGWDLDKIELVVDYASRRVDVTWRDPSFGVVHGAAVSPLGYGSIVLGEQPLEFEPTAIARKSTPDLPWSRDETNSHGPRSVNDALAAAADALLASNGGLYGILVASPEALLLERYGAHGSSERLVPSWSMTKSVTATLIGRLLYMGWLSDIDTPAPAPLWRGSCGIHRLITLDHLLRMRSGLAFPMLTEEGSSIGFENNLVYNTAEDAFETAQRAVVATLPGSIYRYINTGPNVLGAIIRDRIEARGLPYRETLYSLLADRIGMSGYQHSADRFGNLVASGSAFGRLRDYARLGLLYLQDGVWQGERLLPKGWVDYALQSSYSGTDYAAGFRTNGRGTFPSLPRDTAWASGAVNQRVIIMREKQLVIVMANERGHAVDMAALDRFLHMVVQSKELS